MHRFIYPLLLCAGLLAGNFAHAQSRVEPAAPLTLPAALALAEGRQRHPVGRPPHHRLPIERLRLPRHTGA